MEANLGRARADAELLGDRLVGQVVDVTQHDHRAQARREPLERSPHPGARLGRVGPGHRVVFGALVGQRRRLGQLDVLVTPAARTE